RPQSNQARPGCRDIRTSKTCDQAVENVRDAVGSFVLAGYAHRTWFYGRRSRLSFRILAFRILVHEREPNRLRDRGTHFTGKIRLRLRPSTGTWRTGRR